MLLWMELLRALVSLKQSVDEPRMGTSGMEDGNKGVPPSEAKGGKKKVNFPVLQHNQDVMSAPKQFTI